MSVLLETPIGDLVIDLDVEGSPVLCRNFLKLCKVRYYTQTLIHDVVPNRFVILGDPTGTGKGGVSFFGLLSQATTSNEGSQQSTCTSTTVTEDLMKNRFLSSSSGRRLTPDECREKGRVVALELYGLEDTVGSQFLITTTAGQDRALDGFSFSWSAPDQSSKLAKGFLSLGKVVEDNNNILDKLVDCYADNLGRPYADWRITRALIVHDPFEDPKAIHKLLKQRNVLIDQDEDGQVTMSPDPERPPEETVTPRIPVQQVHTANPSLDDHDYGIMDPLQEQQFRQEIARKDDRSRAVVLEMLGDLPDADIKAPENVLFLAKLNAITTDEDLQLIFSRFDENVQVEIVRDQETGQSLNYAFAEFTTPHQATEAYLKMNHALVDDRRIVVDFSQSVAKLWDRHRQRYRQPLLPQQRSSFQGNQDRHDRDRRSCHSPSSQRYDERCHRDRRSRHPVRASASASSQSPPGREDRHYTRHSDDNEIDNDHQRHDRHHRHRHSQDRPDDDRHGRSQHHRHSRSRSPTRDEDYQRQQQQQRRHY